MEPQETTPPEPTRAPVQRRFDRSRIIVSLVVLVGAGLIVAGVLGSVTGREQSDLPVEIERIEPSRGDKVLNQANIVVDLAPGYTGRLIIDTVALTTESTQQALPGSGDATPTVPVPSTPVTVAVDPNAVRFDAGSNTLSFQPRPGADLERFGAGRHLVQVIYWKLTESEANSYSYTWYFEVTA
jgi:hypothetical protein